MAKIKMNKESLITCNKRNSEHELITGYVAGTAKPPAEKADKTAKKRCDRDKDEYFLASMFPSDDVMHRVYSIMRELEKV